MVDHLLLSESRGFVLTPMEVRRLAYDFAESNNIINNFNEITKTAGYDWLCGFLGCHKVLELRKPEGIRIICCNSDWHLI